ncbi:MAG: Serine/threonine protein kinase [Actinomycetia bacterium]|nr:Serine/threonine protein kinase [Actinomycetes bacterium]
MADETQQLIAGRYRLEHSLGSGGMGQVWSASDTVLGRTVAVKVVDLRGRPDEDSLRARVMREARAAARIDDPGSVRVFDVVDEGHAVYLVLELVEAPTLAEIVTQEGPMTPDEAARIGLDLLGALGVAHRAGIVHRDVKPNNVMVLPDGRAKLADFGIASVKDDPAITSTGMVLGTPKYMSPEQARGEVAGGPTDLWGLGALLYFAVEGVPPFDRGATLPTLNAVLHDEPRPTERAGALAPVLAALLAKDPAARPTVDEARRRLAALADGGTRTTVVAHAPEPTTALPTVPPVVGPATPQRPVTPPADRRWLAVLAVVAVVALGAAVAIALTRGDTNEPGASTGPSSTTTTVKPTTTTTSTTTSTTSTTAPAAGRPDGVPSDWIAYQGDGWQIWHPADWSAEPGQAGSIDFTGPDGDHLRVDTVEEPSADPKAAWEQQERSFEDDHPDYQRIRIDKVDYRDFKAAIWEFTFEGQHAADLGFTDGDRGYALELVAADSRWDALQDTFQAFQDGFEVG